MKTLFAKTDLGNLAGERRLLVVAHNQKPLNALAAMVVALLIPLVFGSFFPSTALLVWAVAIFLVNGAGLYECFVFKRAVIADADVARWTTTFTTQSILAGMVWGLGPTLMLPSSTGNASVLLVAMVFGVCVVAITSVAHVKRAMQGFVAATMLPPAIAAFFAPGSIENIVGLVLLAGVVILFVVGSMSADNLRRENDTQSHLQGILDNAQDAVISLDSGGVVTRWNLRAEQMFGRMRGEVIGKPLESALFEPEDTAEAQPVLRRLLVAQANSPNGRFEMPAKRLNGSIFAAEVAVTRSGIGQHQAYTAFIADISKRKEFEQELAVFRRIFEASNQCMVIANAQGYGLYQNSAHEKVLGYTNEEVKGKYFMQALPIESARTTEAEIKKALLEAGAWSGSLVFRRKDGSEFTSRSGIGSIVDVQGRIQYLFNIFTDISDMLAAREALRLAKEEAEQAHRAKSDFLSSMSHELRTPLNSILGFAQMMAIDQDLSAKHQDQVKEISKGGRHLLNLVNQVLQLGEIEKGQISLSLQPLRLSDVVDEVWREVRSVALERRLVFHREIPKYAVVQADKARLKQVVLNLVTNAIKHNRDGGDLAIRALPGEVGLVRLEVTDTGAGIPAADIKNVFHGFIRLGTDYLKSEGTGIGLSISRQLVELMKGRIGVISEVSAGSTFWIELPAGHLDSDGGDTPAGVKDSRLDDVNQSQCVLCIDDNTVNLKLMAQILLKRPNIELITAPTPGQGIQLALSRQPDLILLDINMPGMDGYQVLEVLKNYERTKHIPVIAVTANATPRDIQFGGTTGLADYMTKPLNVKKFLATIDHWLATRA